MADNEIINALNKIANSGKWIGKGYLDKKDFLLLVNACNLITRQKAEVERLTAMVDAAEGYFHPLPFKNAFDEEIEKAKANAIREFAERLKILNSQNFFLWDEQIDSLVEEMVGEGK